MLETLNSWLNQIPGGGVMLAGLLLVCGLILWAAGRRVLKVVAAIAGLCAGFGIGWLVGDSLITTIPAWSSGAILGLVLACLAVLTFRVVLATWLGLALAIAAPLTIWTANELRNPVDADQPGVQTLIDDLSDTSTWTLDDEIERPGADLDLEWLTGVTGGDDSPLNEPSVQERLEEGLDSLIEDPVEGAAGSLAEDLGLDPEQATKGVRQARSVGERIIDSFWEAWDPLPQKFKLGLMAAAALGAITGLLVGTLSASFAASVVTSFGGGGLGLTSGLSLLEQIGVDASGMTPSSLHLWLAIWLGVSLIGLALQWTLFRKKVDTAQ